MAYRFHQRIAVSLWFLPTIYAAAAIVAANLTIWLDARVDAPIGVRPDLVSNRASVPSARQFAPVVSVSTLLALTVATVFGFVASLHGVVRLMRVQYLLEAIAAEGRQAIEENFPPASAYIDAEPPPLDPSPHQVRYTGTAGVIIATDLHGLAEVARQQQCWLELTVGVGEYLAPLRRRRASGGPAPSRAPQ